MWAGGQLLQVTVGGQNSLVMVGQPSHYSEELTHGHIVLARTDGHNAQVMVDDFLTQLFYIL